MRLAQTNTEATPPTGQFDGGILTFLIQQVISTLGAILFGICVVLLISLISASVTKNTSGGNFADHVVEQPAFVLLNEPYYAGPVLCGFILGAIGRRFFRSRSALCVWIVPAVILLFHVLTWEGASSATGAAYWPDVWANYFGSDCGGSECLYEFFVTLPFFTSLAYTLGWVVANLWRGRRIVANPQTPQR